MSRGDAGPQSDVDLLAEVAPIHLELGYRAVDQDVSTRKAGCEVARPALAEVRRQPYAVGLK